MHDFQTVGGGDTIYPTEGKKGWRWGDGQTGNMKQLVQNTIV